MSLHGAPTLNPTGEFPPDTYRSRGYSYCQEHGIHPSASVRVREYELAGPSAPTPASSQYGRDIDNGKKDKGRKGGGGVTQIMTCGAGLFSDGYLNGVSDQPSCVVLQSSLISESVVVGQKRSLARSTRYSCGCIPTSTHTLLQVKMCRR